MHASKRWNKYAQKKEEEDYRKYKSTRMEVKHLIKRLTWGEFGHKMKENYLDNQKLFYGTLK